MKNKIVYTAGILFMVFFFNVKAQSWINDPMFNPGTGANDWVCAAPMQSDGKIIIGGNFTLFNGTARIYIARLNTDGTLDAAFDPGTSANAQLNGNITIQSDGKIIIVGWFTSYNGTTRNRIARLNTDGSLDTTFNPGTGANNYGFATAIQNDGKIIFAGAFTSYNGTARNRIARLNTDGSLDATFNPGTGANHWVNALVLQGDEKIIIVGRFTSYNGTARNYIARLDTNGSLDATFDPGTGANNQAYVTTIQSDGKIIIGGDFTSYNGTARNRIVRINIDGSLDTTFTPGTGANAVVRTISMQSNGKMIIGGDFTTYNGTACNRIACLNSDGSIDTTLNPGAGANSSVYISNIQSDGKIIIGGTFTSFNGTLRNRVARILNCINTTSSITETACDSFTLNSQTYDTSGVYTQTLTNAAGCDSIITLHLTINNNTGDTTASACDSFTWHGATYTTSGSPTHVFQNVAGCDSTVTLHLTINTSSASSISETACESYTAPDGTIHTTSGIKTTVIPNAAGCDSTITIDLTIYTVDVSVVVSDPTITANASGAIYQWVDCDNGYLSISGEINQSFTAIVNGNYAVIVTQGLCSDTSVCTQITTIGINSIQTEAISIYPNPVSNELIIEMEGNNEKQYFEILNNMGQVVFKGNLVEKTTVQTNNFAPGFYLIKFEKGKTFEFKKIIKE